MKDPAKIAKSKIFHYKHVKIDGKIHRNVLCPPRRTATTPRSVHARQLEAEKAKHAAILQTKGVWRMLPAGIEALPHRQKSIFSGMLSACWAQGSNSQPQEVSQHLAAVYAGYRGSSGPEKAKADLAALEHQGLVETVAPAAGCRGAYYRLLFPGDTKDTSGNREEKQGGTQTREEPKICVPPVGSQKGETPICDPREGSQTGGLKETLERKEPQQAKQSENIPIPGSQLKAMIASVLPTLGQPQTSRPTKAGIRFAPPLQTPICQAPVGPQASAAPPPAQVLAEEPLPPTEPPTAPPAAPAMTAEEAQRFLESRRAAQDSTTTRRAMRTIGLPLDRPRRRGSDATEHTAPLVASILKGVTIVD